MPQQLKVLSCKPAPAMILRLYGIREKQNGMVVLWTHIWPLIVSVISHPVAGCWSCRPVWVGDYGSNCSGSFELKMMSVLVRVARVNRRVKVKWMKGIFVKNGTVASLANQPSLCVYTDSSTLLCAMCCRDCSQKLPELEKMMWWEKMQSRS